MLVWKAGPRKLYSFANPFMRTLTACFLFFTFFGLSSFAQNSPSPCWSRSSAGATSLDTIVSRGAANNYLLWNNGQVVKVAFLNGSSELQSKVITAGKIWEKYANIRFELAEKEESHVRIDLSPGKGHKSLIGIESKMAEQGEATMWLDSLDLQSPKWLRATVLHEFGHVLGLLHEIQHPLAGIKWNKEKIYEEYLKGCGDWGAECNQEDLFAKHALFYANGTSYDNKSIMHYAILPWMTLDGYETKWNFDLSAGDIELVQKLYPKNGQRETEVLRATFHIQQTDVKATSDGILITSDVNIIANQSGEVYFVNYLLDEYGDVIEDDDGQYNVNGAAAVFKKLLLTKTPPGGEKEVIGQFIPYSQLNLKEGQTKIYLATVVYHQAAESDELRRVFVSGLLEFPLTMKLKPESNGPAKMAAAQTISRLLPVPAVQQQTQVWCWLAVGEMLFRYYNVPNLNPYGNYQCGIIGTVMPAGSPCQSNCFNNGCIIPSGGNANTMRMLRDYPRIAANRTTRLTETYELSFAAVRNNIDNGQPVVCGISPVGRRYYNDAEHAVLLTGYELSAAGAFVVINDPFNYPPAGNPYILAGASILAPNKYQLPYTTFVNRLFWHWSLSDISM